MLSENENALKSLSERVSHDVFHHSGTLLVQSGSVTIDHILEIDDPIKKNLENALDVLLLRLKFRIINVHNLEFGEDLQ